MEVIFADNALTIRDGNEVLLRLTDDEAYALPGWKEEMRTVLNPLNCNLYDWEKVYISTLSCYLNLIDLSGVRGIYSKKVD